jgi:hypothetical protein
VAERCRDHHRQAACRDQIAAIIAANDGISRPQSSPLQHSGGYHSCAGATGDATKGQANTADKIRSGRHTVRSTQAVLRVGSCRIVERGQDKGDKRMGLRQSLGVSLHVPPAASKQTRLTSWVANALRTSKCSPIGLAIQLSFVPDPTRQDELVFILPDERSCLEDRQVQRGCLAWLVAQRASECACSSSLPLPATDSATKSRPRRIDRDQRSRAHLCDY